MVESNQQNVVQKIAASIRSKQAQNATQFMNILKLHLCVPVGYYECFPYSYRKFHLILHFFCRFFKYMYNSIDFAMLGTCERRGNLPNKCCQAG